MLAVVLFAKASPSLPVLCLPILAAALYVLTPHVSVRLQRPTRGAWAALLVALVLIVPAVVIVNDCAGLTPSDFWYWMYGCELRPYWPF